MEEDEEDLALLNFRGQGDKSVLSFEDHCTLRRVRPRTFAGVHQLVIVTLPSQVKKKTKKTHRPPPPPPPPPPPLLSLCVPAVLDTCMWTALTSLLCSNPNRHLRCWVPKRSSTVLTWRQSRCFLYVTTKMVP